jgi:hypothetical protein
MRSTFIATAIVTAGIFATGYVVGEISGVLPTYAAGTATATPTVPNAANGPRWGLGQSGPHADGTVTAVNGDTITIKPDADAAGSSEYTKVTTITVNGATTYDAGPTAATKSSITVGSNIVAEGTLASDGTTVAATTVHLRGNGARGHVGGFGRSNAGPHVDGTVTGMSGNTITIKADTAHTGSTENENVTSIEVTSSTTYNAGPGVAASKASIKSGVFVIATGTLSSDGKTLTAAHVFVLSGAPGQGSFHQNFFRHGFFGQGDSGLRSFDQGSFTQTSPNGGFK